MDKGLSSSSVPETAAASSSPVVERNLAIDYLKCLAVICIVNSHLDKMYPVSLRSLATGGAIGDVLFFFCSGFTLLLKPLPRFDQWYKRRISRIFPAIFAVYVLRSLLEGNQFLYLDILDGGGYWFIRCILVYYIPLYIIGRYAKKYLWPVMVVQFLVFVGWYYLGGHSNLNCYKSPAFLYYYFSFMLLGAIAGIGIPQLFRGFWRNLACAVVCLGTFYLVLSVCYRYCYGLHLLSAFPLAMLVYFLYWAFRAPCFSSGDSLLYKVVRCIGSLCLEVYVIHELFFTMEFNRWFPLNIIGYVLIVLLYAYFTKILANFFSQTFDSRPYNWLAMIKLF